MASLGLFDPNTVETRDRSEEPLSALPCFTFLFLHDILLPFFVYLFIYFIFLGLHLRHMEVPRLQF